MSGYKPNCDKFTHVQGHRYAFEVKVFVCPTFSLASQLNVKCLHCRLTISVSQLECVLVQAFQAERERINLTTTELDGSETRVQSDESIRGSHLTPKSPNHTAAKPPPPLHIWSMPKSNPHIAFCTFMSTLRSHPLWLGRAIASIPSSLVSVGIEADAIAHAALRGICGFHSTEMNAWAARALLVIRGLDSNPLQSLLADHQTDGPTTTSPSVPAAVLRSFFAVAARPYIHLVLCGVIERISRERIRCVQRSSLCPKCARRLCCI